MGGKSGGGGQVVFKRGRVLYKEVGDSLYGVSESLKIAEGWLVAAKIGEKLGSVAGWLQCVVRHGRGRSPARRVGRSWEGG